MTQKAEQLPISINTLLHRRTLLKSIPSALGIIGFAGCAPEKGNAEQWKTYSEQDYQIDYPASWSTQPVTMPGLRIEAFNGDTVEGLQSQITVADQSNVNPILNIREDFSINMDNLSGIYPQATFAVATGVQSNLDTAWPKIDGEDTFIIKMGVSKGALPAVTIPFEEYLAICIAQGKRWSINFSAHPSRAEQELSVYKKMLRSFHTKK